MPSGAMVGVVPRGCPRCGGAVALDTDPWGRPWRHLHCARELKGEGQATGAGLTWLVLDAGGRALAAIDTVARRVPRE